MADKETVEALLKQLPPHMALQAVVEAAQAMRQRDQFLGDLEAEKGKNHRVVASATFRTVGVVTLLALLSVKIEQGIDDHDKLPSKEEVHAQVSDLSDILQSITAGVARDLGITSEEYAEIVNAATRMAEIALDTAVDVTKTGDETA